jgi:hypothetical protein
VGGERLWFIFLKHKERIMSLQRNSSTNNEITVGTTVADSDAIQYQNYAGGQVFVPTGSSITSLTWYSSYDGITYTAIYDGGGTSVTTTIVAAENCPIPDECFACPFLKAIDAAGGTIVVSLKS